MHVKRHFWPIKRFRSTWPTSFLFFIYLLNQSTDLLQILTKLIQNLSFMHTASRKHFWPIKGFRSMTYILVCAISFKSIKRFNTDFHQSLKNLSFKHTTGGKHFWPMKRDLGHLDLYTLFLLYLLNQSTDLRQIFTKLLLNLSFMHATGTKHFWAVKRFRSIWSTYWFFAISFEPINRLTANFYQIDTKLVH